MASIPAADWLGEVPRSICPTFDLGDLISMMIHG